MASPRKCGEIHFWPFFPISGQRLDPDPQTLAFLDFLAFFVFLLWSFLFQGFEGPSTEKNPCFSQGLLCRGRGNEQVNRIVLGPEKPTNKKHINRHFTGTIPDCPGTVPAFWGEISWEFCLCVSLFVHNKGQHTNKFDPHPFPGQSREVVLYLFAWCEAANVGYV